MIFRVLLYILIFTFSLGQFTSFSLGGEAKVYIFDLLMAAFVAFTSFYLILIKKRFFVAKFFLPFFAFSLVGFISLVLNSSRFSTTEFLISSMYLVRLVVYLLFGVLVFNLISLKIINDRFLIRLVLASAVLISIFGFIQLIVLPDFTVLDSALGWDPHKNRLASTFFDPNFTGGYLFVCFFFVLWLRKGKFYKTLLSAIILLAMFLTFSRSTWGMLVVAMLILGIFKSRKLLLLSFLIGFMAYFAIPRVQTRISGITDPSDSAAFRLSSWNNALVIAKESPILGVGFNAFRYSQIDHGFIELGQYETHSGSGSDSSFLLVFATTGIVGLLLFAFGFFYPLFTAWLIKDYIFMAIFLGLFLQSQFINSLFYPQIMFLWLTLIGAYSARFSYEKE